MRTFVQMKVLAINAAFLNKKEQNDTDRFLYAIWQDIFAANTQDRFLLISDKPLMDGLTFPQNVTVIIAGPENKNKLLTYFWYRYTLPRILKKHNADVYFAANGIASMYTKIPQHLLITDIGFLQHPELYPEKSQLYSSKLLPLYLKKASSVISLSASEKDILQQQFNNNCTLITPAINSQFIPLPYNEKKLVKEKYTEGHEYFLYSGSMHARNNLMHVLKAFSKFKKRQQSNWKLVIAVENDDTKFAGKLNSYKHKDDVVLLQNIDAGQLPALTAAAYAIVAPALYEGVGLNLLQVMQCNVPVIASKTTNLFTLSSDIALYTDADSIDDIAQQLMLLYKDENLCKKLAQKAADFVQQYNNTQAASQLWQTIVQQKG